MPHAEHVKYGLLHTATRWWLAAKNGTRFSNHREEEFSWRNDLHGMEDDVGTLPTEELQDNSGAWSLRMIAQSLGLLMKVRLI